MKINFKSSITRRIRYGFQLFLLIAVKLLISPFTTSKNTVDSRLLSNLSQGYLIIGNHKGSLDPFIICGALPTKTILKILPLAFMTHNAFYDSPLQPLLWISGCFPAKNPNNNHKIFGVNGSLELMHEGYSICIFPEGTRRRDERGPARPGVIRIHKASPSTPLIMAHVEYYKGFGAWLKGSRRVVTYKYVARPHYDDPEIIMDEIFKL